MINDDAILAADGTNKDPYPYVDLTVRLGALILDGLIGFSLFIPFNFLEIYGKNIHLYSVLFNLIFLLFYHVYLVQKYGGTPGKLILGIKIIKINTQPITWREAFLRYSINLLELILTIGFAIYALSKADNSHYISLGWSKRASYLSSFYPDVIQVQLLGKKFMELHWALQIFSFWTLAEIISVFTNHQKRALHDYIAGTVVVSKRYQGNSNPLTVETEQPNPVN